MEIAKIVDGQVAQYPVSVSEVEAAVIASQTTPGPFYFRVTDNFGGFELADGSFVVVTPLEEPATDIGEVAERDGIELVGGVWRWKWVVRPGTADELEQAKAERRAEVDAKRDAVMAGGFVPTNGPVAGHRLQTRNLDDRTNWLTSQAAYSAAVAGGHGAVMGAKFRTAGNQTIDASYADGLATLLEMAAWGAAVMDRSWVLKDIEIGGAETFEALAAIDIEAGWPE